jgi:hypothetical protein
MNRVLTAYVRYGNCRIKLLLNCQPAQMYVKISTVSKFTQTRICYSVYYKLFFFSVWVF